ncbi:MAG TPA: thioesterase family protein [Pseudomonas sp.]|jgi:acyl-CoA thioester hydrolase|nr:thioesterase family protein [Pseudomonas sp.]
MSATPQPRLLHTARIPVRWGDMDSYGHVNNTRYVQYLEEARIAWFASLDLDIDAGPEGPVVLQVQHTYLLPVVHPATVVVELYAGALGRSSLVLEHRLYTEAQPDVLHGEGFCKLVWIDHQQNRSVPLPQLLRERLEAHF